MNNEWFDASRCVPTHRHFVWVAMSDGITVTSAKYIPDYKFWISLRNIYDADQIKYWREKEPEPVHPDIEVES